VTRLRLLGAGTVIGAAVAFAALFAALHPLSVHDAVNRTVLRWSGARAHRSGPLAGVVRDTCRAGEPCRCAALVHGLGDTHVTWRRILQGDPSAPVPSGWRLFAVDMPGTELSPRPRTAAGYAQPAQARALQGALAPLCPTWTVVGNSLGGWTSAWLALTWPEGVERLVLLAPAGLEDPSGASESTARTLAEPGVAVLKEFNRRVTHVERPIPERAFEEMAALLRGRPVRANLEAIRPEHFLGGRLTALRMPVTVLWGASDGVIPPAQAEAFRRELPAASVAVIPACGHLPQMECPTPVRAALFSK
jgi:pimeloyl-ACP methyl ester carboxylesterase